MGLARVECRTIGIISASVGSNQLLESVPQLIWISDAAGAVNYVNSRWCAFTGLTLAQSIDAGWFAAVDPRTVDGVRTAWDAAVRDAHGTFESRQRLRRADGALVWFVSRATPLVGADGAATGWIGTHTDISAEVDIEDALTASEERYRRILDTAQEGIWIVDIDGRTRYVNERLCHMLGYSADELYDTPFVDYLHPTFISGALDGFARRVSGDPGQTEYRYSRRDGDDLWANVASSPLRDAEGKPNGALAMLSDVTERKEMELRLATAAAEYRSLAEATPQIVWTANALGELDYVNARWSEFSGNSFGQAQQWGWLRIVHPDDAAAFLTHWRSTVASGEVFEGTVRLRRADDAFRWHVVRAQQLVTPSGATRWFGTMTDIDDERRSARHLDIVARTSSILSGSFDRTELLDGLATLIISQLARYVLIAMLDEDGHLTVVGSAHREAAFDRELRTLRGTRPLLPELEAAAALRISNCVTFTGTIGDLQNPLLVQPEFRTLLLAAGAGSFVCAPLHARGSTIGVILAYATPGGAFTGAELAIFTEIAERAGVALENAALYARESRVSATLQQALLPSRLPEIAGLRFDALYQPGATEAQIGGDWYDAVELADGRVLVSIGDVTGRGLRAAVIMGRVRQAIEALATYQTDPTELLNAADAVLRRAHPDAIVTAVVGVIDRTRNTFSYATAGHPCPIVRAPGSPPIVLPGHGLPLGLRDSDQPPTSTIALPTGALIALYTDGLTESTRDVMEGERRLNAAIADDAIAFGPAPAHALAQRILFDGSTDDVAVFTVRVEAAATVATARSESPLRGDWSMHWSFDVRDPRTTRDVRQLFMGYLRAKGKSGEDYDSAELVFGELLGNVVRHAPGLADVEVEWRSAAPVLHVLDRGTGYDTRDTLPDADSESGRGLFLVTHLTQEFTVTRLPGYGAHARAVLMIERAD